MVEPESSLGSGHSAFFFVRMTATGEKKPAEAGFVSKPGD